MNKQSNSYTFLFSIIMVVVVAGILAFLATSLKPEQDRNVRNEKMQNILGTVGVEVERDDAPAKYAEIVKEALVLTPNGEVIEGQDAFDLDIRREMKNKVENQKLALYIAEVDSKKYYIVPLRGKGLWDEIWGYVSLKDDINTIKGAVFDHKAETPGLGAEITQVWFRERFADEQIFAPDGEFRGVSVVKGYQGGNDKTDGQIDAISGATITGDGVADMFSERLEKYIPYFKKQTSVKVAANY